MESSYSNNLNNLFRKYAKDLLWMANTEAGRFLIGVKDKDRIIKLSPNSFHQLRDFRDDKIIVEARFSTRNIIAEIFLPLLAKMEIANREYRHIDNPYEAFLHYAGLQRGQYPRIYLTTTTFTPVSSAGSGRIYCIGTWAECQAGTGTVVTGVDFHYVAVGLSGGSYSDNREFIQVNTSSLTALATIISSFIRTYATGDAKADTYSDTIDAVSSTPASTSALATSDYTQIGSTVFSSIAIASLDFVAGHTIDFALNASGLANISLTGWSKFGMRTEKDRANSIPGSDGASEYRFYNTAPYLSVTYTVPGGLQLSQEI